MRAIRIAVEEGVEEGWAVGEGGSSGEGRMERPWSYISREKNVQMVNPSFAGRSSISRSE